jgi:hypothetical protein
MTKESDDLLARWLNYRSTNRIDDYLARGRHLSALDNDELDRRRVIECKAWAANIDNEVDRPMLEDVQAEFALRQRAPPNRLVRDEIKTLIETKILTQATFEAAQKIQERLLRELIPSRHQKASSSLVSAQLRLTLLAVWTMDPKVRELVALSLGLLRRSLPGLGEERRLFCHFILGDRRDCGYGSNATLPMKDLTRHVEYEPRGSGHHVPTNTKICRQIVGLVEIFCAKARGVTISRKDFEVTDAGDQFVLAALDLHELASSLPVGP